MRHGVLGFAGALCVASSAGAIVACGSAADAPSTVNSADASTSDATGGTHERDASFDASATDASDGALDGGDASTLGAVDPWAPLGSLDDLPFLHTNELASHASSCDPTGQNNDSNNALKTDSLGDHVVFDQVGPGVVYRTWFTGIDTTARIKMYFDGETTPRISMTFAEIFDGTHSPFLAPLVSADTGSSGGFYSYVPLPYAKSLRITTTTAQFYDNFDAHTFPVGTAITTFDGIDHGASTRALWKAASRAGDLTPQPGTIAVSGDAAFGIGQNATLLDIDGPGSVRSIELRIPGIFGNQPVEPPLRDDGRAHRGLSQFQLAIDPSGAPITLHRRMDYGVPDQVADVYIEGVKVGTWSTPGSDGANRWRDADFAIPPSSTAGKSRITVAIVFVSSSLDWNEFAYWTSSTIAGANTISDLVDVGSSASETAHAYLISGQTWSGAGDAFTYPPLLLRIDDGRAHRGTSQFTLAIDPANDGVILRRRLDYSVADQAADIAIDGIPVGTWSTPGSDVIHSWRDAAFLVPPAATAGKSKIAITMTFKSSSIDYNEFAYWVECTTLGKDTITDTLDIGNAASEAAHGYSIQGETWRGFSPPFTYPSLEDAGRVLDDLWLRASWDGETTPSIFAPLSALTGIGPFGPAPGVVRSLAFGMRTDGSLYVRFPMPFRAHATIELVNRGALPPPHAAYSLLHAPFAGSFDDVGELRASYQVAAPSMSGRDLVFVDASGRGRVVGVVESATGPTKGGRFPRWYLEGNERAVIDMSPSPVIQGTGTEDFFNGGWYFENGPFTLPLHGNASHTVDGATDSTTAYRIFMSDAIPFRNHMRLTIQHAASDELNVNAWTLAYYYSKATPQSTLSDALVVGDAASEAAHGYAITSPTWSGTRTLSFEGENAGSQIAMTGRAHIGESRFTLAIDPANRGVILRRRFDQAVGNQRADVYVAGIYAATFYKAGSNGTNRWRDEEVILPASLVSGKGSIDVKIAFVASDIDWNEFGYEAYSLK